jgi:DNA-binding MarR family transcriptional regulator
VLKDAADLYQARPEEAREVLHALSSSALDALDLMLSEAPEDSNRERYRYAREHVLPLLLKLEDEGEREAALKDATNELGLTSKTLSKALNSIKQAGIGEDRAQEEEREEPGPPPEGSEELVSYTGVLDRYVEDVSAIHGVVGERPVLKLQTLVALGAQLAPYTNGKPTGANLIITAEPGRGKNHVCDAVAGALPEEFCLRFESASAKSLYYKAEQDPTILQHTWIYPNEAEATDQLVEMFRPLLSGGKASHMTVNKDAQGRNAAQELNVEGPTSITIPTVRNKLDGQLQTRMLVAELTDYEGRVAAHSSALSKLLLPDYAAEDYGPKVRGWQAALRSLTGVRRVVLYLEHEGFCFDSDQVSHGARLWGNLLGLMLAHAWLEQKSREIVELPDGERAVVATAEDYETAYLVFKDTCERSVVNLSDTHRKILTAVDELEQESPERDGFSQRKIADKARVALSTVSENKTFLTRSVKLLREVEGEGLGLVAGAEPSWWEKGDLLVGFPHPEQVRDWWEEYHSAPDPQSAEQPEQPNGEGRNPLAHGENGVRHPSERRPNAAERLDNDPEANGGVRQKNEGVRQGSEHQNGIAKPETSSESTVFEMFGSFEGKERSQVLAVGLKQLFEEHPEYRKRRSGQIACRMHTGRYTPFVPTEEEIDAAMEAEVF